MNQSLTQINFMSSVRYFLGMGLTYAAAKGYISSDTATNGAVLMLALLPFIWAMYSNYLKKTEADDNVTTAVRAGVAMGQNGGSATSPANISKIDAQNVIAAYAPVQKEIAS